MVDEVDQWIEEFVLNATKENLHTLLNFFEDNNYNDELINSLKLKIDEAP